MTAAAPERRGWVAAGGIALIGLVAAALLGVGVVGLLRVDGDGSGYIVALIALAFGVALAAGGFFQLTRPSRWSFNALLLVTLTLFLVSFATLAGGGIFILPFAALAWAGLILHAYARQLPGRAWVVSPIVLLAVLLIVGFFLQFLV